LAYTNSSHILKKTLIILLLLFGFGLSTEYYSQSGGRKKERRERKGKRRGNHILFQYKSRGHADRFARGNNGKRSRLARLFRKNPPVWKQKTAGSVRSQYRANRYLFFRFRTKGKMENAETLDRQNKKRGGFRVRGSQVFQSRKYKARA
jgi:hypothetical protein